MLLSTVSERSRSQSFWTRGDRRKGHCARGAVSLVAPRGVQANFAPRTQRQSLYAYLTDGGAYQPERRKSHLGRHAANLAVLAFTYRELKPRRRNFRAIADRRISRPQFLRFLDQIRVRRSCGEVA